MLDAHRQARATATDSFGIHVPVLMIRPMKYNLMRLSRAAIPVPTSGTVRCRMEKEVLPLWVADMDFRTAPVIVEALERRVRHGIFGYVRVPDAYYESVARWFARRHGWKMETDWIIYTSGVVPAISAAIKALTVPGDGVVVQTPVYNCFSLPSGTTDAG